MRTETIEHDGARIAVRTAYRKTPVIEAVYTKVLSDATPELKTLNVPTGEAEIASAVLQNRVGWAVLPTVQDFVAIAARIVTVEGDGVPFAMNGNGRFEPEQVKRAYDHFMSGENDDDDLWTKLSRAVERLDKPLVSSDPNATGGSSESLNANS